MPVKIHLFVESRVIVSLHVSIVDFHATIASLHCTRKQNYALSTFFRYTRSGQQLVANFMPAGLTHWRPSISITSINKTYGMAFLMIYANLILSIVSFSFSNSTRVKSIHMHFTVKYFITSRRTAIH